MVVVATLLPSLEAEHRALWFEDSTMCVYACLCMCACMCICICICICMRMYVCICVKGL